MYDMMQRQPWYRRRSAWVLTALVVCAATAAACMSMLYGRQATPRPQTAIVIANPLQGQKLYVDPNSHAAQQANAWRTTNPAGAELMYKLADQPGARWFTNAADYNDINGYVTAANNAGTLPVTVAYYLPQRDCNKYSAGGAPNQAAYRSYIDTYASAIGTRKAIVILEPDAIVHMQTCLSKDMQLTYMQLLSYAVGKFSALAHSYVYLDAGNSGWVQDTAKTAQLLQEAGLDKATGFSVNVSNFQTTADSIAYGNRLSSRVGGKHFVLDTSRNGNGPYANKAHPDYDWCNPPGRALGHYPTTDTGVATVDAYLFIKNVGESDGADPDPGKCFGGPAAGSWWPEYALGLVQRWPADLQYHQQ